MRSKHKLSACASKRAGGDCCLQLLLHCRRARPSPSGRKSFAGLKDSARDGADRPQLYAVVLNLLGQELAGRTSVSSKSRETVASSQDKWHFLHMLAQILFGYQNPSVQKRT